MPRAATSAAVCAALCLLLLNPGGECGGNYVQSRLLQLLSDNSWDSLRSVTKENPHPKHEDSELDFHNLYDDLETTLDDGYRREAASKRSAVATALNAGRRRRQPAPAIGVLNDVGSFFNSLRDNLETLAVLTPQQRATLFHEPPTVVHAPSQGGGGSGTAINKLYALRPLRPTGNVRSYNRRSFVESDGMYPAANYHDPGLLWTGLGRRRRR